MGGDRGLSDCLSFAKRCADAVVRIACDLSIHRSHVGPMFPSLGRRILEQGNLLTSNSITALDYYQLGLFDPNMSFTLKRTYVGSFQLYRFFDYINDRDTRNLLDDKILFHKHARKHDLPVPELLAVLEDEQRGAEDELPRIRGRKAMCAWFTKPDLQDLVLKPSGGTKGWGILSLGGRISGENAWRSLPLGVIVTLESLLDHVGKYLGRHSVVVQERLIPHDRIAPIMPGVLSTVRVLTYLADTPEIVDTVMRISRGQSPADNFSQGGILVPVDPGSGVCGTGMMVAGGLPCPVDRHPVTGVCFAGIELPLWRELKDLVRRAAEAFSTHKSVGWDVALTNEGARLIEGNYWYGLAVNQIARRQGLLQTKWRELVQRGGGLHKIGLGRLDANRLD